MSGKDIYEILTLEKEIKKVAESDHDLIELHIKKNEITSIKVK